MLRASAWLVVALFPLALNAQPLPQSTLDRQAIATLQWRLQQPGVSTIDRLEIQRRIIELQYRIATRPAIAPQPTLAPFAPRASAAYPAVPAGSPAALSDAALHCETLRGVIAYLGALRADPSVSNAERAYTNDRIAALHREARAWRCPSAAGS